MQNHGMKEREARSTDKVIDSRGNKDGYIYVYVL